MHDRLHFPSQRFSPILLRCFIADCTVDVLQLYCECPIADVRVSDSTSTKRTVSGPPARRSNSTISGTKSKYTSAQHSTQWATCFRKCSQLKRRTVFAWSRNSWRNQFRRTASKLGIDIDTAESHQFKSASTARTEAFVQRRYW